jgi:DNA-binding Xre family transcriptional regulator
MNYLHLQETAKHYAKLAEQARVDLQEVNELNSELFGLIEALCEELDIDVEALLEDVFDAKGEEASQGSLVKLADRATLDADSRHVSNKDANASMRRWSVADKKAKKRRASKTIYTAKGGRVVKKK